MHQEGAGPDYDECRAVTQKWYNKDMLPTHREIMNKRGPNKWSALSDWHESLIDSIASCKDNYERKLDSAKHDLLKKETEHPLYARCERLHESLCKSMQIWRGYKRELEKVLSPEEFERVREENEGIYTARDMIGRLRIDLKCALEELKDKNTPKSALDPV